VVHRDIKPDNILVAAKEPDFLVKLTDFGWCAPLSGQALLGKAGSVAFMAPEVSLGGVHGSPCDIYSLGLTLQVLLSGGFLNSDHRRMLSFSQALRPTAAQLAFKFPNKLG
jgi:calcium/calmodulin-dependent protein kinase I